jgi:hypothetical protein
VAVSRFDWLTGNVDRLGLFLNGLQGSLDTTVNQTYQTRVNISTSHMDPKQRSTLLSNSLVDVLHQTRSKLDTQRLSRPQNGIPNSYSTSLLVNLDRASILLNPDDFTDELVVSNTNQLVHGSSAHLRGDDDGSRDTVDDTELGFSVFISDL